MSKVKRPQIVKTPRRDQEAEALPPPRLRPRGPQTYGEFLRRQVSAYAFGTLLCGAAMIALAAWLGGSLGSFGKRMDAGFDVIMRASGLTLQEVVVMGLDEGVEARVREAAGLDYGLSMLKADPQLVRARLEALDPVGAVSVHRLWPDQVTIIAEERAPMALWKLDGDWRVIDQRGRVFSELVARTYRDLPRVEGPGAAEAAGLLLTILSRHPDLAERLESAERIGGRRWDVTFEPGVEVAMPEDARLAEAIEALQREQVEHKLLDQPLERIDARHSERFALRPIAADPGVMPGESD
ncbi:FtsQ-type POTRA domain-containing protein [bacterium]|nr:FtsQ-type POTRA domain-containing protein [bacterium]